MSLSSEMNGMTARAYMAFSNDDAIERCFNIAFSYLVFGFGSTCSMSPGKSLAGTICCDCNAADCSESNGDGCGDCIHI